MGRQNLPTRMMGVVEDAAPPEHRQAVRGVMVSMQRAGEPDTAILLALADVLSDGLRHGNWPEGVLPC